jgi:hypothetical protein
MKPVLQFLLVFASFSLLIAGLFLFFEPYIPAKAAYSGYGYIQLIVMAATLAIHFGLRRAALKSNQAFVRFFMAASALKMMVFLIIMLVFGLMNRAEAFGFILHFFVLYLVYTVFEVTVSYRTFSRN